VTKPGLYIGAIMHQRLRPRRHRFDYSAMWMLLDLDCLEQTRLFSVDRFNLFAFHQRDHGDGSASGLREKIAALVADAGLAADGKILLLTAPRILGYVFNPLSVYFCFDRAEALSAIVWEVSNTFGERHSYVLPVEQGGDAVIRQRCKKLMHVSPFIGMDLEYRFRVARKEDALSIGIVDEDSEGPLLVAALNARWRPLTDGALLAAFARAPFSTIKTIVAIHWEALRLYLRGVGVISHPPEVKKIASHSSSTISS
jgi:uncharacterized protein